MDTKKIIWTIILAIFLLACDPQGTDEIYYFKNNSNITIKVNLYKYNNVDTYEVNTNSEIIIKEVKGLGAGGFGDIGIFDSLKLVITSNNKILKWEKPNGIGYIDVDNGIGTDRNIGKDFYNRKYWKLKTVGDDEEWTFTINEEDLSLFE